MVLFKRKPVKFDPTPSDVGDYDEVWVIEKTGEVYNEYDKYLRRLDFYAQKLFTCESTGHSGYTFFEAMESQVSSEPVWEGIKVTETQTEASREIDSIFPDTLRSRVLHFVQFRTTSRMDDLVNLVFDEFKEQYMVGDRVCIEVEGPINRRYGVITDITDNSQLHQHAFTRSPEEQYRAYTYVITMDDNNEPITKYKAADLQRDRKYFSKLILKQFLRSTVTRESWIGAPWMAREHLAKRYKIPTKIPDNKTRESVMAQKKLTNGSHPNGTRSPIQQTHPHQLANGGAPQTNGHRPQQQTQHGQGPSAFVQFATNPPHVQHLPHLIHPHAQQMHGGLPPQFAHQNGPHHLQQGVPLNIPNALPPSLAHLIHHPPGALPVNLPFQNGFMQYQQFAPRNPPQQQQQQQQQLSVPTKPFEPIKYPIEDLEISQPRLNTLRPSLKFFSDDVPDGVEGPAEEDKTGILMRSVGPLLCAWETLNVHDTIYSLDSFTFDDFADAMRYSSEEQECELFVEVHCSVLKQIVGENGKLQASLPNMAEADESEEEDSSEESTPTPEPEPPKRTTRSSLRKSEVQQIVEKARTPTPEPPKEIHKAAAFVADFDWVEQLKIRNFQNGGWQAIMVALLYRLSFDPLQKETCDEILAVLVPGAQDPTIESIAENYRDMDVNLRVSALDQVLRLTVTTEAFRDQLNAASLEMTRLRKEKIEFQRKRKELADDLFKLDLERKIKLPDNTPASPSDAKENEDVSMLSVTESVAEAAEGDVNESEDASAAKSRTRTKNKRKAAAEEARKEKAKKAKIEAEKNRKQKEWEKLLKSVEDKKDELKECEANINELDDDLRETLVHRSKVLGKDRFLNKYYWFEHNGMPFGGVPNSSTAEYGYANGRIWVQGPDAEELQPCLEEPALSQDMQRFKFTIPQRKEKEEGSTHLATSKEWAYYDDPEDIDRLIGWLDERGHREKQLRKELQIFRDRIAEYMEKMKKHLTQAVKAEEDEEDEDSKPRVSTRGKANADKEEVKDRCLLWTNSIMLDEYGYTHATEYEPPRKGKARVVKTAKSKGRR